jgi:hypothetical protein
MIVSKWNDKSGLGNHFIQTVQTSRPAYVPGTGVVFTGTEYLTATNNTFTPTEPYNIFIMANVTSPVLQNITSPYDKTAIIGDNGGYFSIFVDESNVGAYYYTTFNEEIQTTRPNTLSSRYLYSSFSQNNMLGISTNGQTAATTPTIRNMKAMGTQMIGAQYTGSSQAIKGDINEVLIYATELSTIDRQKIEGYMAWKWGTQALLPTTHPYKNTQI